MQSVDKWQLGNFNRLVQRWVHQHRHLANPSRQFRDPFCVGLQVNIALASPEKIKTQGVSAKIYGGLGIDLIGDSTDLDPDSFVSAARLTEHVWEIALTSRHDR